MCCLQHAFTVFIAVGEAFLGFVEFLPVPGRAFIAAETLLGKTFVRPHRDIAETGDLNRFSDWKQVRKLAGLNLVEQSSGQHKGKTTISKRGRPDLRRIIYIIGDKGMLVSTEMMEFYQYLRHRPNNQLKHDQAVLAVGLKLMRILFHVVKHRELYDPQKALGEYRISQIVNAA